MTDYTAITNNYSSNITSSDITYSNNIYSPLVSYQKKGCCGRFRGGHPCSGCQNG